MSRCVHILFVLVIVPSAGCTDARDADESAARIQAEQPAQTVQPAQARQSMQPRNFSWLEEGRVAGMARPRTGAGAEQDAAFLKGAGVQLLVSLTEALPDQAPFHAAGITSRHIPIKDFTAPSIGQLGEFVSATKEVLAKGGAVTVHCAAGQGRTGTFLAAWLVANGQTAEAAIARVRVLRPGSIETPAQEAVIGALEKATNRLR